MRVTENPSNIQRSLSVKLAIWALSTVLIFTAALTALDLWRVRVSLTSQADFLMQALVESRQHELSEALINHDDSRVQEILHSLNDVNEINHVLLQVGEQRYEAGSLPSTIRLSRDFDIGSNGAQLTLQSSLSEIPARINQNWPQILFGELALCTCVSLLVGLYMHLTFVRPLNQIARYMQNFRPDEDRPDLKIKRLGMRGSYDELDALTDHVNALKDRVRMSNWALQEANTYLEKRVEERTATILDQRHKLESSARWTALGEMAGSIAHEINNPLAIIMGKAQILLNRQTIPAAQESLEMIVKTTERIASIIRSLRVLARDASQDAFEYVSARQVVQDALSLSEERLRRLNIRLDIAPGFEEWNIRCRRVQIAQILISLMNNSIDALDGHSDRWMRLEWSEIGRGLQISLVDSGPGIPLELREKVMTPFFTTKEVGHTGMGLSLARSIMDAHKGALEVDFTVPHTTVHMIFRDYRHHARMQKLSS